MHSRVFLTNLEVLENVLKHSLECLTLSSVESETKINEKMEIEITLLKSTLPAIKVRI